MGYKFSGLNTIQRDSFFIRLKDKPTHYIHFEGDNPDNPEDEVIYRVNESEVGACIWTEKKAKAFIKMSNANNLEMVNVRDVLKNDSSSN